MGGLHRFSRMLVLLVALFVLCVLPTVKIFADDYGTYCTQVVDCSLYDPNSCSTGGSNATTESINGDVKSLASQILANKNISFDYGVSGPTGTQFTRLSQGKKAQTDNGREVDVVQPIILITILHLAQGHKVNISALTDGSSHTATTNPHGSGNAVDINIFDGSHTTGSDDVANRIINTAAEVLPEGSRFGMGNGPFGTKQISGKTFSSFTDNPTHVHVDVMGVKQSVIDKAVADAGGGGSSSAAQSGGKKPVYIMGDSITRLAKDTYLHKFNNGGYDPTVAGLDNRHINSNPPDPGGTGQLVKDQDIVGKASGGIVIALGTNDADNSASSIKQDVQTVLTKAKDLNASSAPIFWVNTMNAGNEADSKKANQAIADAVGNDATVIDWYSEAKDKADLGSFDGGVYPTKQADINLLVNLVYSSVSNKTASTQDQNVSCCGSGGTSNLSGDTYGEQAMNFFINDKHMSKAGAAGIVGNMTTESIGVEPQRLENHITEKIKAEDVPASEAGGGYGLVQWTPARDKILKVKPVTQANDMAFQLDYLWKEITTNSIYTSEVVKPLMDEDSPEKAADTFLLHYEHPRDPSATINTREGYARAYFNLVTKGTPLPKNVPVSKSGSGSGSGTADTSSSSCGDQAASGSCNVTAPVYGSVKGSGGEYTVEQLTNLFGDPGTASSHPEMDKNLVEVKFLGKSVQINKKAAACLQAVSSDLEKQNVKYTVKEIGCYRFDSDNGSSNIGLKSYHTYGVACDINPSSNPFSGSGAPMPHDMPEAYIKTFHDHGFTWGGDWNSVKDYMHFEFNGLDPKG